MTINKFQDFSDDELWVMLETFRDCNSASCDNQYYNIFRKLLTEIEDEYILR